MLTDIITGLVEIALDDYNEVNKTKIKLEDLNIYEFTDEIFDTINKLIEKKK